MLWRLSRGVAAREGHEITFPQNLGMAQDSMTQASSENVLPQRFSESVLPPGGLRQRARTADPNSPHAKMACEIPLGGELRAPVSSSKCISRSPNKLRWPSVKARPGIRHQPTPMRWSCRLSGALPRRRRKLRRPRSGRGEQRDHKTLQSESTAHPGSRNRSQAVGAVSRSSGGRFGSRKKSAGGRRRPESGYGRATSPRGSLSQAAPSERSHNQGTKACSRVRRQARRSRDRPHRSAGRQGFLRSPTSPCAARARRSDRELAGRKADAEVAVFPPCVRPTESRSSPAPAMSPGRGQAARPDSPPPASDRGRSRSKPMCRRRSRLRPRQPGPAPATRQLRPAGRNLIRPTT